MSMISEPNFIRAASAQLKSTHSKSSADRPPLRLLCIILAPGCHSTQRPSLNLRRLRCRLPCLTGNSTLSSTSCVPWWKETRLSKLRIIMMFKHFGIELRNHWHLWVSTVLLFMFKLSSGLKWYGSSRCMKLMSRIRVSWSNSNSGVGHFGIGLWIFLKIHI